MCSFYFFSFLVGLFTLNYAHPLQFKRLAFIENVCNFVQLRWDVRMGSKDSISEFSGPFDFMLVLLLQDPCGYFMKLSTEGDGVVEWLVRCTWNSFILCRWSGSCLSPSKTAIQVRVFLE